MNNATSFVKPGIKVFSSLLTLHTTLISRSSLIYSPTLTLALMDKLDHAVVPLLPYPLEVASIDGCFEGE